MNPTNRIKFLYSYGGMIVPRQSDGKLCYVGGFTRVLAVDRSITFTELMVKFGELCECSMNLRCKLPSEDLDLLVSITCDEDLAAVINEYDRVSLPEHNDLKIRAVLVPLKSLKKSSSTSCVFKSFPPATVGSYSVHPPAAAKAYEYGVRSLPPVVGLPQVVGFPVPFRKGIRRAVSSPYLSEQGRGRVYLVRRGNHWQLNNNVIRN